MNLEYLGSLEKLDWMQNWVDQKKLLNMKQNYFSSGRFVPISE